VCIYVIVGVLARVRTIRPSFDATSSSHPPTATTFLPLYNGLDQNAAQRRRFELKTSRTMTPQRRVAVRRSDCLREWGIEGHGGVERVIGQETVPGIARGAKDRLAAQATA
jgi:hypothetical protein